GVVIAAALPLSDQLQVALRDGGAVIRANGEGVDPAGYRSGGVSGGQVSRAAGANHQRVSGDPVVPQLCALERPSVARLSGWVPACSAQVLRAYQLCVLSVSAECVPQAVFTAGRVGGAHWVPPGVVG